MNIEKLVKESFCVIGKEGSTLEGEGFVQRLWDDANGISLVGAVHDFTDPATGKNDMLFPIRCLERSRQV